LAPATLEEGYQFDVMLTDRNRPYTVTVPRGGVKEGEEFEIPIPAALGTHPTSSEGDEDDEDKNGKDVDEEAGLDRIEEEDYAKEKFGASSPSDRGGGDDDERTKPPTGRWRRGLCGCCGVLTQATFWMGCICTPILMGQLLTRLNLDWRGRPTDDPVVRAMTFNRIVMSAITVLLLGYIPVVGLVIILLYWIGVVVVIGSNVRTYIRRRYRIRTTCCPRICDGRFNDCLCMLTCGSCATIQMARQTHNDLEYPGYCCTTTGLTPDAPRLV
jgi:Cys-rich protein (TIGR01571 family)